MSGAVEADVVKPSTCCGKGKVCVCGKSFPSPATKLLPFVVFLRMPFEQSARSSSLDGPACFDGAISSRQTRVHVCTNLFSFSKDSNQLFYHSGSSPAPQASFIQLTRHLDISNSTSPSSPAGQVLLRQEYGRSVLLREGCHRERRRRRPSLLVPCSPSRPLHLRSRQGGERQAQRKRMLLRCPSCR